MNLEREYIDYLRDILDALHKSQAFINDMTFEEFARDDKTVFSVVRALEVIGEAAKQIPGKIRQRYEQVPWRGMAGMRDKLIHHYFGVDNKIVWRTVTEEVPDLIEHMQDVIRRETCQTE